MPTTTRLPSVIAALHLPPFPGAAHPDARSLREIRDYVLRNVETAVQAGVQGLYLQDLGDHPVAPHVQPHVVAGVAAGAAWYVTRGPLELWMAAAYFAWGVVAFLILDRAIERRFRQGWLRRILRVLLAACFAWTVVAPWRLLCRLSDWYFERHPLTGPAIAWPAFERGEDSHDDDSWRYLPAYSWRAGNIHHDY